LQGNRDDLFVDFRLNLPATDRVGSSVYIANDPGGREMASCSTACHWGRGRPAEMEGHREGLLGVRRGASHQVLRSASPKSTSATQGLMGISASCAQRCRWL